MLTQMDFACCQKSAASRKALRRRQVTWHLVLSEHLCTDLHYNPTVNIKCAFKIMKNIPIVVF